MVSPLNEVDRDGSLGPYVVGPRQSVTAGTTSRAACWRTLTRRVSTRASGMGYLIVSCRTRRLNEMLWPPITSASRTTNERLARAFQRTSAAPAAYNANSILNSPLVRKARSGVVSFETTRWQIVAVRSRGRRSERLLLRKLHEEHGNTIRGYNTCQRNF
jgi:hypothetical protein